VYPHSTVHADEHPSPSTVLPSSHPSDVVTTLLPHSSLLRVPVTHSCIEPH